MRGPACLGRYSGSNINPLHFRSCQEISALISSLPKAKWCRYVSDKDLRGGTFKNRAKLIGEGFKLEMNPMVLNPLPPPPPTQKQ